MQVFLPDENFAKCAEVLDTKRLVKQLLEGRQIMTILAGESPSGAWRNHPAVKMFAGHEGTLYTYLKAIRNEMRKREYKWENNWETIQQTVDRNFLDSQHWTLPNWMQDGRFTKVIITHRGRLHQKAPELYPQYQTESRYFMDLVCCPGKCTYYWVTHKENNEIN